MRIAVCSDESYPIHAQVIEQLKQRGHEVCCFGAINSGRDEPWAEVAAQAARSIVAGDCAEGIFFCWSGTGISIAANKHPGIRAALCTDARTAEAARVWNHANVLCLSNRLLSADVAKEILAAWFADYDTQTGASGVACLNAIEAALGKARS